MVLDTQSNPQNDTNLVTYSFVKDDFPTLVYRLMAGSPHVKVDLVDAKTGNYVGNIDDTLYLGRNSNSGTSKENGYESIAWSPPVLTDKSSLAADGTFRFKISVSTGLLVA